MVTTPSANAAPPPPALIAPVLKIPPETVVLTRTKASPTLLLIVPVFTMRPVIVVKLLRLLSNDRDTRRPPADHPAVGDVTNDKSGAPDI